VIRQPWEHYELADSILAQEKALAEKGNGIDTNVSKRLIAKALVHAMLANAPYIPTRRPGV
jgi:hypothetical protein